MSTTGVRIALAVLVFFAVLALCPGQHALVGAPIAKASIQVAPASWVEVPVESGDHSIILRDSNLSLGEGVETHLVFVYAEGLHSDSQDYHLFTLNGVGDSVRVGFSVDGRAFLGLVDATPNNNAGGSRVAVSGVPGEIYIDGIRNCAWFAGTDQDHAPQPSGAVFSLQYPDANSVHLAGSFNEWSTTATPMSDEDGDGVWTVSLELDPGTYQYKFVIDGGDLWLHDESNPESLDDGYGGKNSVVVVSATGEIASSRPSSEPTSPPATTEAPPLESSVRAAIESALSGGLPLFWYPTQPEAVPKLELKRVEVVQIGRQNEERGYWPVKARLVGSYMGSFMKEPDFQPSRKPLDITKEFRLRRDDWGEWEATPVEY